ncbi:hypothetical protein RRF57_011429 [Xylaria bambusicola]|uniref:Uncharacterized protein n=1 Tax=Xylaria bambusicola TaxID=326684 RepID=A0AAN7Z9T3_9PEZI
MSLQPPTRDLTRDDIVALLMELPSTLNLTDTKQATEDTLNYQEGSPFPSLRIILPDFISSLPWKGREYSIVETSPPLGHNVVGSARWECEQLAAFIRANSKAFDGTQTNIVVLARSNGVFKPLVLVQIVGSLITTLAAHLPQDIPQSLTSRKTERRIAWFNENHDLEAGLAVLSSFPPLKLDGKGLILIVDVSDVIFSEDKPSKVQRMFLETLHEVAIKNAAIVIRVANTKMGVTCYCDEGIQGRQEYRIKTRDASSSDELPNPPN